MARHARWIGRTVLVNLNHDKSSLMKAQPHEKAYQKLTVLLQKEDILRATKRNRYYEKPWMQRRRIAYEECQKILHEEMLRKMRFLANQNRRDPWRV